jgi:very-short-patch-repair endonuclease
MPTRELFPGATRPNRSKKKEQKREQEHIILMGVHLKELKVDYFREYSFHETRGWRFDFCLPGEMLGIEIDGGIWGFTDEKRGRIEKGRHTSGAGFQEDLYKLNAAAIRGWAILRFSVQDVRLGIAKDTIAKWLRAKRANFREV